MARDIRDILLSEMDSLISGKSDIKRARAVTKLGAQVIYKDRLKIEQEVITTKKRRWEKRGEI